MTNPLARLRSLMIDDAWLKFLALALAIITWSYIDSELPSSVLTLPPARLSRPLVGSPQE